MVLLNESACIKSVYVDPELVHTKYFRGVRNTLMLISKNDKFSVSDILQKYVINWYHTYLLHTCTERT